MEDSTTSVFVDETQNSPNLASLQDIRRHLLLLETEQQKQKRENEQLKREQEEQKRANEQLKREQEEQKRANEQLKREQEEQKRANEQLKREQEEQKRANEQLKREQEEQKRENEELKRQLREQNESFEVFRKEQRQQNNQFNAMATQFFVSVLAPHSSNGSSASSRSSNFKKRLIRTCSKITDPTTRTPGQSTIANSKTSEDGVALSPCCVLGNLPTRVVLGAHIVPRKFTMLSSWMEIGVNDARNGLLLFDPIEAAFDEYKLSIVLENGQWLCRLMDESIRNKPLLDSSRIKATLNMDLTLEGMVTNALQVLKCTSFGDLDGRAVCLGNLNPFKRALWFQAKVAGYLHPSAPSVDSFYSVDTVDRVKLWLKALQTHGPHRPSDSEPLTPWEAPPLPIHEVALSAQEDVAEA